jgi:hypothetical protein
MHAETGSGSLERIKGKGFVGNLIFWFIARLVFGHASTMETCLRDLGSKFGETIQSQP